MTRLRQDTLPFINKEKAVSPCGEAALDCDPNSGANERDLTVGHDHHPVVSTTWAKIAPQTTFFFTSCGKEFYFEKGTSFRLCFSPQLDTNCQTSVEVLLPGGTVVSRKPQGDSLTLIVPVLSPGLWGITVIVQSRSWLVTGTLLGFSWKLSWERPHPFWLNPNLIKITEKQLFLKISVLPN